MQPFSPAFPSTVLNCLRLPPASPFSLHQQAANVKACHFCPQSKPSLPPTFVLMLVCPARLSKHQLQPQLPKETDKAVITWPGPAKGLAVPARTDCIPRFPQAGLQHTPPFSPPEPSLMRVFYPQPESGKPPATLAKNQKKSYLYLMKRKEGCGKTLTTRTFQEPAFSLLLDMIPPPVRESPRTGS